MAQYSDLLSAQNKRAKEVHSSPVPVRQLSDSLSVTLIKKSPSRSQIYEEICSIINDLEDYQHVCLTDSCPGGARERYMFLKNLNGGLDIPVVLLTYSPGNNCSNLHFVWKCNDKDPIETIFTKTITVVEIIKPLLPQYHTHAMKRTLFTKFGRISKSILNQQY